MNKPRIALLCPSKQRPERKMALINSLIKSVKDTHNITLFMGIDDEGDETLPIMQQAAKSIIFLRVVNLNQKKLNRNIHTCWNYLAQIAFDEGYEILSLVGDDFVFETYGWDEMIIEEFTTKLPQDKWKLVTCWDKHRNGEIPVNYFVHRFYYEVIGYIACDAYRVNWCDNHIKSHFIPFTGRYVYRPDITIAHNHWVFTGQGPDKVGAEMVERNGPNKEYSDQLWPKLEPQRYSEVLSIAKATGLKPDFKLGEFNEKYW